MSAFGHHRRGATGQVDPSGAGDAGSPPRAAAATPVKLPRGKAVAVVALLAVVAVSGLLGQAAARLRGTAHPAPVSHQLLITNPYRTGGVPAQWLRAQLHVASVNGIGKDLPRTLGQYFANHGYQFLAITDQNTYTWTEIYGSRTLAAIPAIEADYPSGSLLALEMDHWLPAQDLQAAVDWIRHDGGFPILARPLDPATPQVAAQAVRLHNLFGVEVYDARLAGQDPQAADATALWDRMLSSGQEVYAIAGDDVRSLSTLSQALPAEAWITVLAPASNVDSLLNAIQQGAFYASTGATFKRVDLAGHTIQVQADAGTTLRFIGRNGRLLATATGGSGSYTVRGTEGYVRVEATTQSGARAWSQPFFIALR